MHGSVEGAQGNSGSLGFSWVRGSDGKKYKKVKNITFRLASADFYFIYFCH
jgi:hypothetical protein